MMKRFLNTFLVAIALLCGSTTTRAQWMTQSVNLKAGWNAVFLHVDASHATLDQLIGDPSNPIQEVWLWAPSPSTLQFIDSPQQPTTGGSQWVSWSRNAGLSSVLNKLIPNAAYLVRVDSSTANYTWNVKGKPIPFKYDWTTTGLNFIGFPTTTSVTPPTFDSLLSAVPELKRVAEIFHYPGGDLGANNPMRVFALRTQRVQRGQAFWIRSQGVFNRYFAPFEVDLAVAGGVHFGDSLSQSRLLLRNVHPTNITVSVSLLASETVPSGQTPIIGMPPILVRGLLNQTNLTYPHTNFASGARTWTLAPAGQPGAEVEIVLGVNRSQLGGNPGDLFAGVLRFNDSLGFSQVDIPISAVAGSTRGLWVGNAALSQVQHYLKTYEKDSTGKPTVDVNGKHVAISTNTTLGDVARTYPIRLIVHNGPNNNASLLQRVYYGYRAATNLVVATREELLDSDKLSSARRISSIHFPWSDSNQPWACSGLLKQGGTLTTTVDLGYNSQPSNPFVHTYHPDHDNVDATFNQTLPVGFESYRIKRDITLSILPPSDDFTSLTTGNQSLSGEYKETMTFFGKGTESRQYQVGGAFSLTRINGISTLTTQ